LTALLVMEMGQRKKQSSHEYNHNRTTLLVALFGGACAFITVESIYGDANDAGWQEMNRFPAWQVHMGSVCVGIITFFVFLFILELLETRSRITAWRSTAPWLPLVGFTVLATIVHIPFCIVLLAGSSYAVWAYRRTSSVRRAPGPHKGEEIA
jgi:uncharacterized BrkB/YihY/UPF0761 family membrane protein